MFINLPHHFCSFSTEGNQAHWELLFSLLEKNFSYRYPDWVHQFHCTWWTWFHHNIRKLIKDDEFVNLMNDLELRSWTSFVDLGKIFLGDRRTENNKELVGKLLKSLQDIDANMRIMVHFLNNHLDKFPDKWCDLSDEQGEWVHQDIKTMEECYQERLNKQMMAFYCWSITRDLNNIEHDRQSRKRKFLT